MSTTRTPASPGLATTAAAANGHTIRELTLSRHILPMAAPLRTAARRFNEREVQLVRLVASNGVEGWGEASPLPGFSPETIDDTCTHLHHRAQALRGTALPDSVDALPDWLAPHAGPASANHGLELAVLDWLARTCELPIARLLTDEPRGRLPLHKLVASREAAEQAAGAGYRCLKLKVGVDPLEYELPKLRSIRRAVGPDVALRLDANGAWDEATAFEALTLFAEFDIELVEQPVAADALDAMARLRQHAPIRIAADESARTADDIRRIVEQRAADVIVIKPMLAGGLLPALEMARLAHTADVPVIVTTSLDAAIGRAGAAQMAAAVPGKLLACGLSTGHVLKRDIGQSLPVVDGCMQLPDEAGLGTAPALHPARPRLFFTPAHAVARQDPLANRLQMLADRTRVAARYYFPAAVVAVLILQNGLAWGIAIAGIGLIPLLYGLAWSAELVGWWRQERAVDQRFAIARVEPDEPGHIARVQPDQEVAR